MRHDHEGDWQAAHILWLVCDPDGTAFLQGWRRRERDEQVPHHVPARRVAQVVTEVMGADGGCIFTDQALFRAAGGGYAPQHEDKFFRPLHTLQTITTRTALVYLSLETV